MPPAICRDKGPRSGREGASCLSSWGIEKAHRTSTRPPPCITTTHCPYGEKGRANILVHAQTENELLLLVHALASCYNATDERCCTYTKRSNTWMSRWWQQWSHSLKPLGISKHL